VQKINELCMASLALRASGNSCQQEHRSLSSSALFKPMTHWQQNRAHMRIAEITNTDSGPYRIRDVRKVRNFPLLPCFFCSACPQLKPVHGWDSRLSAGAVKIVSVSVVFV